MNRRKERLSKVVFIINGFVFALGAFSYFSQNKLFFALLQLITALLNIFGVISHKRQKIKIYISYLILIFNILVALSISYDLFELGKKYIQYAWITVAIVSFVAIYVQYKKDKFLKISNGESFNE